uniref:ATP synthase F0 subunit 8 n=1 Tax=Tropidocephala brunnipennis TaxID=2008871 RepID=A0A7S4YYS6_9HEMI|nr:ATP synthase F0 subunit 8 [Tropidocephala brunnipennis]QBZ38046.1 ATP synthase F0 subunit 8 [Tropidocephala brunnipennis]
MPQMAPSSWILLMNLTSIIMLMMKMSIFFEKKL